MFSFKINIHRIEVIIVMALYKEINIDRNSAHDSLFDKHNKNIFANIQCQFSNITVLTKILIMSTVFINGHFILMSA